MTALAAAIPWSHLGLGGLRGTSSQVSSVRAESLPEPRARASSGPMKRDQLEALLKEHAPAILALCHQVAGSADARDAAQEALARIVSAVASFDPAKGTFRGWALTVARNVCRDRLRRRGLERAAFDARATPEGDVHLPDVAPDPERVALARIDARALGEALAKLPEPMRASLVLFHVHDASYEEIAAALGVPIGTVMTWLHRGRKKLREALAERGTIGTGESTP